MLGNLTEDVHCVSIVCTTLRHSGWALTLAVLLLAGACGGGHAASTPTAVIIAPTRALDQSLLPVTPTVAPTPTRPASLEPLLAPGPTVPPPANIMFQRGSDLWLQPATGQDAQL